MKLTIFRTSSPFRRFNEEPQKFCLDTETGSLKKTDCRGCGEPEEICECVPEKITSIKYKKHRVSCEEEPCNSVYVHVCPRKK